VPHAIPLLDDRALRKWASVVAMAALGSDHPNELVVASVVRASFWEGLLIERGQVIDELASHPCPRREQHKLLAVEEHGRGRALAVYHGLSARRPLTW